MSAPLQCPDDRISLQGIQQHPWYLKNLPFPADQDINGQYIVQTLASQVSLFLHQKSGLSLNSGLGFASLCGPCCISTQYCVNTVWV